MTKFFYKAKNKNNEVVSDSIFAENISEAALKLENSGLTLLEIKEEIAFKEKNTYSDNSEISDDTLLTMKEKLEFFNSFYYLFKSGLSIFQIFSSIQQSSNNKKIKGLCGVIIRKVEKGASLEKAFSGYEKVLGLVYSKLIVAGETSGKLEKILLKVISNIKREEDLKSNMISALSYPVFVLLLAIAVFLLFKLFILKVFSMMGSGFATCALLKMFVIAVVQIIAIFAVLFGIILYCYFNKKILRKIINLISKLSIVKPFIKSYSFTNFFSVLELAYDAGVPLSQSIELANSVISISSIKAKISSISKRILNGCEVTTAFVLTQVFSPFAISQISAGEQAGELEKMFAVIALDYEKQIDLSIKVLNNFIKVFSLVFVGFIVLYVVVTAYKSYYKNLFEAFGII